MRDEKPHSLREDAEKEARRTLMSKSGGRQAEWIPGKPLCTCGRYHCPLCQWSKEIKAAVDAEIERRKRIKGHEA